MHRISKRSHFNRNNMASYNGVDRSIDDGTPPPPAPQSKPAVFKRTLRSQITGDAPAVEGIKLRAYAGDHFLGFALSSGALLELCERGYLEADEITVRGKVNGEKVDTVVPERDYDRFRDMLQAG